MTVADPALTAVPESTLFLEMEKVSVARGDTMVLHDVSLRIANGEHIAILGQIGRAHV